jgi:adenylosuccinate lyase
VAVLISGTLGKIGNELYNLMRTEINEVEEPFSRENRLHYHAA